MEKLFILPDSEGKYTEGGIRTTGYHKISTADKPLITIITVVFNCVKFLEGSILSVINQKYDNIEYIIIDGGSIDGTVDIIKKYEQSIDYWLSANDRGIYDAMNKAIALASPDAWVLILGADDKILDINCLVSAVLKYKDAKNFQFDVERKDIKNCSKRRHMCRVPNADKDFLSFPLHHQGFVFKKDEALAFDLSLGVHADLHFMYTRIYRGGLVKVDEMISSYLTGGASSSLYLGNAKSIYSVARKLQGDLYPNIIRKSYFGFLVIFVKATIRSVIKRFLRK